MNRDALADLVLAEAARYRAVREVPVGSNRGVEIDYWVGEAGLDPRAGAAWCACYVGQVGRQALGRAWPCPRTASVHDPARHWTSLVAWAEDRGVLVSGPARGDLFALWNDGLGRFAHVGFVQAVVASAPGRPPMLKTIEGNSNPGGGREGYGVFELARTPGPRTRYIRWVDAVGDNPF